MTQYRILRPALLIVAAALGGCGACDGERETRRIDLGVTRPPEATPSKATEDAPPAAPAGEEIAATPQGEGGEPPAVPGDSAADDQPSEPTAEAAAAGSATTGVGASPPQQP